MTRDEAVDRLSSYEVVPGVALGILGAVHVLDAIGFDQRQERIEELERRERFRVREFATEQEWSDVIDERDAARALADQLADMLKKDDPAMEDARAFITEHGPFVANGVEICDALNVRLASAREFIAAYEARDWK